MAKYLVTQKRVYKGIVVKSLYYYLEMTKEEAEEKELIFKTHGVYRNTMIETMDGYITVSARVFIECELEDLD